MRPCRQQLAIFVSFNVTALNLVGCRQQLAIYVSINVTALDLVSLTRHMTKNTTGTCLLFYHGK